MSGTNKFSSHSTSRENIQMCKRSSSSWTFPVLGSEELVGLEREPPSAASAARETAATAASEGMNWSQQIFPLRNWKELFMCTLAKRSSKSKVFLISWFLRITEWHEYNWVMFRRLMICIHWKSCNYRNKKAWKIESRQFEVQRAKFEAIKYTSTVKIYWSPTYPV